MPTFVQIEDMERAHAAYNNCTEELAAALNEVKKGKRTPEQLQKIADINKRCEELHQTYIKAFKLYYGEQKEGYA